MLVVHVWKTSIKVVAKRTAVKIAAGVIAGGLFVWLTRELWNRYHDSKDLEMVTRYKMRKIAFEENLAERRAMYAA